jgi:alpha-beta hydrolase superfamily lysophospholipase
MDKFIATIQDHPDQREDATPYYLLHKQGEYVYGTVLMFHGFSATTGQMVLLAQYLFENGFNVYQPALCGHYFNKPAKYWPLVCIYTYNAHTLKNPHIKRLQGILHPQNCLNLLMLLHRAFEFTWKRVEFRE